VQSFPSKLIANWFGFKEEQVSEVEESLRGDAGVPRVDFGGEAPGVTFGGSSAGSAPAPSEGTPPPPPAPTS
jgi:hypothetical protein